MTALRERARRNLPGGPDDGRLLRRAADGDEAAFSELYDRHSAALLSFCRYMVGSREDAEDAVQQTFVRAFGRISAGDVPRQLVPWLYAIARNRCLTLLGQRARVATPVDTADEQVALDGLDAQVARREELRTLVREVDALPEEQRAALVLFELGDLSQREVADVLSVPEPRVKALVHQARRQLIARRAARERPCDEVQAELALARGAELRRAPLRLHLRGCSACRSFRSDVERQRAGIAAILPVAGASGLREAVLAASGGAAAGGGAALLGGGGGALLSGTLGGGLGLKLAAGVAAVGIGAAGTHAVLDSGPSTHTRVVHSAPVRSAPATTPARTRVISAPATQPTGAASTPAAASTTPTKKKSTKPASKSRAGGRAKGRGPGSRGNSANAPGQTKKPAAPKAPKLVKAPKPSKPAKAPKPVKTKTRGNSGNAPGHNKDKGPKANGKGG